MIVPILVALTLVELAVLLGASRALQHGVGGGWLTHDDWFGWDKIDHAVGGFAAMVALASLLLLWRHPLQLAWAFILVVAGVEVLEVARYASWVEKQMPAPRPEMCDRVSWKDALWSAAGGLLAVGALLRILP